MELGEGVPVVEKCHDDTKGKFALDALCGDLGGVIWISKTSLLVGRASSNPVHLHGPKYIELWAPLPAGLAVRAESDMEQTPRQDKSDLISGRRRYRLKTM